MPDLPDWKLERLETFASVPGDISKQIRIIAPAVFAFIGIILGIPECRPYYVAVFLITFSVFTSAVYLCFQSLPFLYIVPLYYLYLAYVLHHSLTFLISSHAICNAFILVSAYVISLRRQWRTSPTVLVTTAIITEDPNVFFVMFLAMFAMRFVVIQTASLLADLPYPIQLIIQGVGAAIPISLLYTLYLRGLGYLNITASLQSNEREEDGESLWNKVLVWREQVALEKASLTMYIRRKKQIGCTA
ncbi:hypothetical protein BCR33DRAFT_852131 [Rhizoclosmatium globosum]|uniref:Uncharacterized protein n=1 Tax=Rhizoclosmatium globosum TaxID=329046 RepID=A0A1Y2C3P5_9FUNG|nr:hypothetical protein BCR33DRAFT_852131 [Rhizoclosmatium globosum]|eukprot:ORY41621.1 hypothetical protein BCR33DRAFT_852131 [Rhizoclosmatium globosum]